MRRASRKLFPILAAVALAVPLMGAPATADPTPRVPPGFTITPFAVIDGTPSSIAYTPATDYLGTPRFYVADYAGSRILAIEDLGGVGGPPTVFADGDDGVGSPLGVTVGPDGTVYVADSTASTVPGRSTSGRVWKMTDTNDDAVADEIEVLVTELPNGRHNTNGMAIGPDGLLYIANGNSTDDGIEGGQPEVDPWSGSVVKVDPNDGPVSFATADPATSLVANGMRNVYDLAFSPFDDSKLFVPMNGADDARDETTSANDPAGLELADSDDLLYQTDIDDTRPVVGDNGEITFEPIIDDFGFPECLYNESKQGNLEPFQNPHPQMETVCPIDTVPRPVASLGLHVSADGLAFQTTDAWGADFKNDLFIAEWGNLFGTEIVGHEVVRVELDETGNTVVRQSEFVSGIVPLDVTFDDAGALYVADFAGSIYRVAKIADVPSPVNIAIDQFQFRPPAIAIPEGTTIRWSNVDSLGFPHEITAQAFVGTDGSTGTGSEIDSDTLGVGGTHEFRFDTPGKYIYTCAVSIQHQALMHGEITVLPTGS